MCIRDRYNLTNINITERAREIATLKVLGFTPREVNAYIFREIVLLAMLGALAVSYTHLDVYKRQSEGFRAEGEAGGAGCVEPFKFRATARSFLGAGHLNEGFQLSLIHI